MTAHFGDCTAHNMSWHSIAVHLYKGIRVAVIITITVTTACWGQEASVPQGQIVWFKPLPVASGQGVCGPCQFWQEVILSGPGFALQVSLGWHHALLLDSWGRVWAWGSNRYGQCGRPRIETTAAALGHACHGQHPQIHAHFDEDVRAECLAAGAPSHSACQQHFPAEQPNDSHIRPPLVSELPRLCAAAQHIGVPDAGCQIRGHEDGRASNLQSSAVLGPSAQDHPSLIPATSSDSKVEPYPAKPNLEQHPEGLTGFEPPLKPAALPHPYQQQPAKQHGTAMHKGDLKLGALGSLNQGPQREHQPEFSGLAQSAGPSLASGKVPATAAHLVTALLRIPCQSVSAGSEHSLAVARDGTVFAWGWGEHGQLGLGHQHDTCCPTRVPGLQQMRQCAGGCGFSVSFA